MLAALGFFVGEKFHPLFGGDIDVPSYVAFQATPLQEFWTSVILTIGIFEFFSIVSFEPGRGFERFLVVALHALLTRRLGLTQGNQWLSVSDFGAGVGQLGHTLLCIEPTLRHHGYDGAGNVEAVTNGFLSFADLTLPPCSAPT
jgi:hypothetical protein